MLSWTMHSSTWYYELARINHARTGARGKSKAQILRTQGLVQTLASLTKIVDSFQEAAGRWKDHHVSKFQQQQCVVLFYSICLFVSCSGMSGKVWRDSFVISRDYRQPATAGMLSRGQRKLAAYCSQDFKSIPFRVEWERPPKLKPSQITWAMIEKHAIINSNLHVIATCRASNALFSFSGDGWQNGVWTRGYCIAMGAALYFEPLESSYHPKVNFRWMGDTTRNIWEDHQPYQVREIKLSASSLLHSLHGMLYMVCNIPYNLAKSLSKQSSQTILCLHFISVWSPPAKLKHRMITYVPRHVIPYNPDESGVGTLSTVLTGCKTQDWHRRRLQRGTFSLWIWQSPILERASHPVRRWISLHRKDGWEWRGRGRMEVTYSACVSIVLLESHLTHSNPS